MVDASKYYRKFQNGGVTLSPEAQAFIQEIQQNPENAATLIAEALQDGREQIVAEAAQAVPELKGVVEQVIKQLQAGPQEAKKGAKIKKACGGKWLDKGGEVKKELQLLKASKGCGCKKMLHKQGGRIIEICE